MTPWPHRPEPELATPGPIVTALAPTPTPETPREIVRAVWEAAGYGWEWPFVEALVQCESAWRIDAVGRQGELGLFQLMPRYHAWRWAGRDPFDPRVNAEAALGLRVEQGWRPWSCAR